MEHIILLVSLFFLCQAHGALECREQAVSAGETLRLLPEKPPQRWVKVDWRVTLDSGHNFRILTAEKNQADQFPKSPFSGRAGFQRNNLSLWISAVGTADSGVYRAEFEDTSGAVTVSCFCVSMWEPVRLPHLEQNVLHREQGWCNLSLVCAVPGANNVSYSWTCSGDPLGDPEPRSWVHLQVHDDDNLTVCSCNTSNPVSWSVVSTDIVAACRAAASGISQSYCLVKGLLCLLVLGSLGAAVAGTHVLVQRIMYFMFLTKFWVVLWRGQIKRAAEDFTPEDEAPLQQRRAPATPKDPPPGRGCPSGFEQTLHCPASCQTPPGWSRPAGSGMRGPSSITPALPELSSPSFSEADQHVA